MDQRSGVRQHRQLELFACESGKTDEGGLGKPMNAVKSSDAIAVQDHPLPDLAHERIARFPRLRYMGSKYRLIPHLTQVFAEIGGITALDAFSGSGVVAYALKCLGYAVTANDFLAFPAVIARAAVANQNVVLSEHDLKRIAGPAADERDFIQRTFEGLYFTAADRRFLDSAWSHIDTMSGAKRALAIAALVLASARKQPRGVFTVTDMRYDDGRRNLHLPLREMFFEAARDYNGAVFHNGAGCHVENRDVFDLARKAYDLVYLDPPYAPPKDDNCYIKRYHFLEGLAVYWRGVEILHETRSRKLAKRYTPFSYKHSIVDALRRTFERFRDSTIVLSYSSNAVPDADTIQSLLRVVKRRVEVRSVDHRYHFGTHANAKRREVAEWIFVGRS